MSANGTPPLQYQWLFNGAAVAGATGRSLTVSPARPSHAGSYAAVVSNAWNSTQSAAAQLQVVEPPTVPQIVAHPVGDVCPVGYACSFHAYAVGQAPLVYQWMLNGTPLTGATNASLLFSAVQTANAGIYTLLVSNVRGTALSLPAKLVGTNSTGGGRILINHYTNNAPIYEVDGSTRLAGTCLLKNPRHVPCGCSARMNRRSCLSISEITPNGHICIGASGRGSQSVRP